jgi:hypothetical protein
MQSQDRPAAVRPEYGQLGKARIETAVEAKLDRNIASSNDNAFTGNRLQKGSVRDCVGSLAHQKGDRKCERTPSHRTNLWKSFMSQDRLRYRDLGQASERCQSADETIARRREVKALSKAKLDEMTTVKVNTEARQATGPDIVEASRPSSGQHST